MMGSRRPRCGAASSSHCERQTLCVRAGGSARGSARTSSTIRLRPSDATMEPAHGSAGALRRPVTRTRRLAAVGVRGRRPRGRPRRQARGRRGRVGQGELGAGLGAGRGPVVDGGVDPSSHPPATRSTASGLDRRARRRRTFATITTRKGASATVRARTTTPATRRAAHSPERSAAPRPAGRRSPYRARRRRERRPLRPSPGGPR